MSSTDSKKIKKRKTKKGVKTAAADSTSDSLPIQHQIVSSSNCQELKEIERLMDAGEEDTESAVPPLTRGSNPYLGRERCLLCRCERPDQSRISENTNEAAEDSDKAGMGGLSQLALWPWVCPDCQKTVEEEEKRAEVILDPDLRLDTNNMQFLGLGSEPTTPNGTLCTCEACSERRQIEAEHERETQELQQCWMELRHVVRCVYRQAGTGLSHDNPPIDGDKMKESVHRLCSRDCHQLYQRLESQGREFVIEMKVRLLKQLTSGHKTPAQAKQFVTMLLDEFASLCSAANILSSFLAELESEHLKRFNVTWERHNKHLFQSIIYTDPLVQNSLPMLITQLRLGAGSKEAYHEDTYPNILHRYLKFDDEMSVISVVWRDCHQLLEEYNQEQATLKAKQKMLKEDWEFFKAQRKILEQQVLKSKPTVNSHGLDAQFTQTMRQLLQGTKPNVTDECHCPNCNRKRCPCDECTISHMITCGILNPEVTDNLPAHHQAFSEDPSQYIIDITPPSMSSTTSSSCSSSPIMVDPERLTLPFEDCPENFELPDDGIPEELEEECSEKSDSDDESNTEDVQEAEPDSSQPTGGGSDQDAPDDSYAGQEIENCDCSHCTIPDVQQVAEENPCQCHACLQQSGAMLQTSLPQTLPASVPRPAALHLYPHIHGANNLHARMHSHTGPVRPLLHPHLYDLHAPVHQQPKPLVQPHKVRYPFNLDIDTHEALNEHIYHAYGEWDNPYDTTKLMASPHDYGGGLSTELLPPPPLVNSPFSDAMNLTMDNCSVTSSVQSSTLPHSSSFVKAHVPTTTSFPVSDFVETPPCFKNLKPINRTVLSPSRTRLVTGTSTTSVSSTPKMDMQLHTDLHCPKHNPFLYTHHTSTPAASPASASTTGVISSSSHAPPSYPVPMKMSPDLVRSTSGKDEGNRGIVAPPVTPVAQHSCSHAHTHGGSSNNSNLTQRAYHTQGSPSGNPSYTTCTTTASSLNNVSVGTSMVCHETDLDGHHDENYDSVDDSCSEQSSSTSTSNQKDGKYCDCCYCEFFGHSTPPVAPTSRNYAEMREKLRLRLKKKNEQKVDEICTGDHHVAGLTQEQRAELETRGLDELGTRGLDELLRYINGTDNPDGKNGEKSTSSKAAKRARQKQRKAEERARQEEEERRKALQAEQEEAARQLAAKQLKEAAEKRQQRKKKSKHKITALSSSPFSPSSSSSSTSVPSSQPQQHQLQNGMPHNAQNSDVTSTTTTGQSSGTKAKNKKSSTDKNDTCTIVLQNINNKNGSSSNPSVNLYGQAMPPQSETQPVKQSKNSSCVSSGGARLHPHQQRAGHMTTSHHQFNGTSNVLTCSSGKSCQHQHHDGKLASIAASQIQQGKVPVSQVMCKNGLQVKSSPVVVRTVQNNTRDHQPRPQGVRGSADGSSNTVTSPRQHPSATSPQAAVPKLQKNPSSSPAAKMNGEVEPAEKSKRMKHVLQPPASHSNGTPSKVSRNNIINQQDHHPPQHCARVAPVGAATPAPPSNNNNKKSNRKLANGNDAITSQFAARIKNLEAVSKMNGFGDHSKPPALHIGKFVENDRIRVNKLTHTSETNMNGSSASPVTATSSVKQKNKKKKKQQDEASSLDEIFLPKQELDLENGDLDESEKELEMFKRFCHNSKPQREKIQVNVNIKDIFTKKKSGVSCA